MAVLHVKLNGTGKQGDPFRPALPTFSIVGEPDYKNMCCVVEVPDNTLPDEKEGTTFDTRTMTLDNTGALSAMGGVVQPETVTTYLDGDVITGAPQEYVDACRSYFDETYKEHAGKFALELVP